MAGLRAWVFYDGLLQATDGLYTSFHHRALMLLETVTSVFVLTMQS